MLWAGETRVSFPSGNNTHTPSVSKLKGTGSCSFLSKKQKGICKVLLFTKTIAGSTFAHPKTCWHLADPSPQQKGHLPPWAAQLGCAHALHHEKLRAFRCVWVQGTQGQVQGCRRRQWDSQSQPSAMFQSNNKCSPATEQHFSTQEGLISQEMGLANPGMSPVSPHCLCTPADVG